MVAVLLVGAIYLRKVTSFGHVRGTAFIVALLERLRVYLLSSLRRRSFACDLQRRAAIALSAQAMPIPGLFGI